MITHSFGIVNYLVLFGYLLAMMLVGVYFSRRQKNSRRLFSWWWPGSWLGGWS
nr:putative membrane transporter [Salmonella sp. NCTC 7297]